MTPFVRLSLSALALATMLSAGASARSPAYYESAQETRAALARALAEQKAAARRGQMLDEEAAQATEAADRTARQAAALAARIQQSEAGLAATEARLRLINSARAGLRARLAERQRPVVRLTAALQNLSRRPMALSLLRPGSVRDMVYLRAVLASTVPQVSARTAALRSEIDRLQALRREAGRAAGEWRVAQRELEARRVQLAGLETRQRLASRVKSGIASREADRVLALAEEARDLDGLVGKLDAAGSLRQQLALLPGPIIRPPRPDQSEVLVEPLRESAGDIAPPARFQLPVTGRAITGFGAPTAGGNRSQGLTIMPRARALVVAPATGRVAFAGPYRGYGQIVIIEHQGGWTSLVTGLLRVDVDTGEQLVGGAPLGIAPVDRPTITIELRRDGVPVNPAEYVR
jgi:septal ring factor EnvC (AmiA/AmiB activator)